MSASSSLGLEVYSKQWAEHHAQAISTRWLSSYILSEVAKLKHVHTILDVGCGSGHLVGELSAYGYLVTGYDAIQSNIEYARKHFQGTFIQGRVEDLADVSFAGARTFDVVVLSHILEHLANPAEVLRQVAKFLRPRGRVLIVVPNLGSYSAHSLWRSSRVRIIFDSSHLLAFTRSTLEIMLIRGGYTIERVTSHTSRGDILNGVIVTLGRLLLTHRLPAISDKSLVKEINGKRIEALCSLCSSYLLDRLSERKLRGSDLMIVARIAPP